MTTRCLAITRAALDGTGTSTYSDKPPKGAVTLKKLEPEL